ncbi:GH25 family lysozyme [Rhizobium sp. SG2393]|uniref:GH25 family lysozyme n=1 Tax=Rhizobium sp. SG2393 TaxID=3276279 RepID=UPI00366E9926
MRFPAVPAMSLVCLLLAGCASSSTPEVALAPIPSSEVTSSVVPAATPPSAVSSVQSRMADVSQIPSQPAAQDANALAFSNGPAPSAALAAANQEMAMAIPLNRPGDALRPALSDESEARPGKRSRVYSQRFRDAKPMNFGKRQPRHYAVHGVDVSRWQGDIDWVKLRSQGANFAYIKATDGGDHLDPMFKTNWRKAHAAGLKRGAYHFFYWCRTASEQAAWFIRNVPRDPEALPPVIDVEWNGESKCRRQPTRAQVLEKMRVFMDMVEAHYGQRPIIYTAPDFYEDNLSGELKNEKFWLRAVAQHPSKVYPGRKWHFWQYSGSGLSHGVSGKIDLNVWHGSEAEWYEWSGQRGS